MKEKGLTRKKTWMLLCAGLLVGALALFVLFLTKRQDNRVSHVLQREGYAATEDFARLFCQDVQKAVRFAALRQELETDGKLDFDAEIAEAEVSEGIVTAITLNAVIEYGEQLGLHFDENHRLVTDRADMAGSAETAAAVSEQTPETPVDGMAEDGESELRIDVMAGEDKSELSDDGPEENEETDSLEELFYYPTEEELEVFREGAAQERLILLRYLYDLAEYYELQQYLCVKGGETNFAYCFVYADAEQEIYVDQNLKNPGNLEDVVGLGSYFRLDSDGESISYNFHDSVVADIFSVLAQGGMMDGDAYELAAGVNINFPCHDQYYSGLISYRHLQWAVAGLLGALALAALISLYATVRLLRSGGSVSARMDQWLTEPAVLCVLAELLLLIWALTGSRRLWRYNYDGGLLVFFFCLDILSYLLLLRGVSSLERRYRKHEYYSRSLFCRLWNGIWENCRGMERGSRRVVWGFAAYLLLNSLFCAGLALAVLAGSEGVGSFWGTEESFLALFCAAGALLLNGGFFAYLVRRVKSEQKIIRALARIAGGEMEVQLDEKKFRGQDLVQARAINAIGEGLSKAVAEQTKSERMKTDLIANVSHDLRTPLTSIINYVDLIRREHPENPRIQNYLEVLEQKSQRLRQLTEDLLDVSKVSSGNMPVNWMRIDLVQLVNQMEGEFQEKLDAAGLIPVTSTVEPPLYIQADGRLLFRVLENLYNNVCKYSMSGTRVYMDLRETSHKAIFTIRNISAAPLNISAEELTERFVRGDSSRTTEGTGLGLSIAQSITELLKGSFEIYLEGDLFRVRLVFPLDESASEK